MNGDFVDQGIDGMNEKIMDIVKTFKGDNTEVEILKQILIQANLLLATQNVRDLLTSNIDASFEPVVNEETNEVREDMKKLAEATSVVRISNYSDIEACFFIALLNVNLSKDKNYQIETVYNRVLETKFDVNGSEDDGVSHIHYILRVGKAGEQLKDVVDFEFVRASPFPPGAEEAECDSCSCSCDECEEECDECEECECKDKKDECCCCKDKKECCCFKDKKEGCCCKDKKEGCCCCKDKKECCCKDKKECCCKDKKDECCCKDKKDECCCKDKKDEAEESEEDEFEEDDFDDDGIEEEILKLDFDMDVMDSFTEACEVGICSEDLLAYLVNMEFYLNLYWESDWEIGPRLSEFIEEMRNPDPDAYVIEA